MDASTLIDLMNSINDEKSIYLLKPLSSTEGFFTNAKKLLYVARDNYMYPYEEIETDYLRLQTHMRINSVKNDQSFLDDYYNIIIYEGNCVDTNLDSFIQLCSIHATHAQELNFKEFFYSLIALFQLPTEQGFANTLGLYGELKVMQYVKNQYDKDISNLWHQKGSYSQFDFSNGKKSMEVKTTLLENTDVMIKHQQVFGGHPCYIIVVACEQYENGETIEEVIDSMHRDKLAFKNMNFNINLAKELKRISIKEARELRLKFHHILFFDAAQINPFPFIPENVSKLVYRLDTSELLELSEAAITAIISDF